ncbi:hypothetical protein LTR53_013193 [Teratosphaeriaceae sp. CCFEE 6253]|nr:hypothetical protein LTR53_013193 [Teratosphaeriaceae sp. CCFEE 6253]
MAPMTKESEKAAKTLISFLEKGKIPAEVLEAAKGLAIFTVYRAGAMWVSGTAGSGIVVARLPDATWSPPSGFSVMSGGIGMTYGLDVYDCICVLNTQAAVDAYTAPEFKVGGRMDFVAGPAGGKLDVGHALPVWTYTRSLGLYGGVTLDGTVIREQTKANAEFYGEAVTAAQILQGAAYQKEGAAWPVGAEKLAAALNGVGKRA